MKKMLKVVLPTLFFLAFGFAAMVVISSCEKEPGSKCSECTNSDECDTGLQCYSFTDGKKRCVEEAGDLCSKI
jgi:hypothetical protein